LRHWEVLDGDLWRAGLGLMLRRGPDRDRLPPSAASARIARAGEESNLACREPPSQVLAALSATELKSCGRG